MMITIIALIVLLMCILFIKSTTISSKYEDERPVKINVFLPTVCAILAFIPDVKWVILFLVPIVTIIWYCTDGFDDNGLNGNRIEVNDETIIGKILLFKI